MTHRPLFSVVIPVYNRLECLKRALATVISQDIEDWEAIVVDDGSTTSEDPSHVETMDSRIKVIKQPTNMGVSAARNRGIEESMGDYIAFLDSDDEFHDSKLSATKSYIETHGIKDNVMLFSRFNLKRHDITGPPVPKKLYEQGDDLGDYLFIDGGMAQTSTTVISRDIASRFKFQDGISLHEDWDYMLNQQQLGARIGMLPDSLTVYHYGEDEKALSVSKAATGSQAWSSYARKLLSTEAYDAFVMRVLAPAISKKSRVQGVRLFASAWRRQSSVKPLESARCFVKCASPVLYRRIVRLYLLLKK